MNDKDKYDFYCINFEEGCRVDPCKKCCQKCKGWSANNELDRLKKTKQNTNDDSTSK